MRKATAASAQRVQALLGPRYEVLEFDASTKTAADAAMAVGCAVAQIAKSLVFRTADTGEPVLVVASGVNRVDDKAVARLLGRKIKRADADFVREKTGFAIGGIPPVGHITPAITLLDEDLRLHAEIWAAGGTPNTVFRLAPDDLLQLTTGRFARIAAAPAD